MTLWAYALAQTPQVLEASQPIEQKISGTQRHQYQLTLSADQYLEVAVEQRGIDVTITLNGPDGRRLAQFDNDSRPQGRESVTHIATTNGNHPLIVEAKQKDAPEGSYEIKLIVLRPATAQDRALQEARRLNDEATPLITARKFDDALALMQRVLTIRERELGTQHDDLASALHRLATIYRDKNDSAQAEPLYLRAIAIAEKTPAPGHPGLGLMYLDLGALFFNNKSDYIQAQVQFQRALTTWEQTLGSNHPDVGRAVAAIGNVFVKRGELDKAETALMRSLEIVERAQGKDHPNVFRPLNTLGTVYMSQNPKRYDLAEPIFQRALQVLEKQKDPPAQSLAGVLNNLGIIYNDQQKFALAETFYRRSLAIREKQFGTEHPDVAQSLNNLAALYAFEGDYAKSEPIYQQVLTMREKLRGPDHPEIVSTLRGLNRDYVAQNNLSPAIVNWSRAAGISERNLSYNLTIGSEREKLAYLSTLDEETNQIISLHLRYAPDNPEARRLSLTTILRRKGRALDSMTDSIALLRRHATPEDQKLLDQLKTVRSQLANLVLGGPQSAKPAEHLSRIKKLEAQREELENEISRRSSEFRAQSQPVTLEAVQALIPEHAALVEFVAYRPFNAKFTQPSKEFDVPCYAAYVLHHQGEAQWVELGEKQPIDEAIGKLRSALRDRKRKDFKTLARIVDKLLMQPVRPLLGKSRRVLIAPDGGINLVPFAALVDADNRFLIKRYSFSYLTSGRDLLRLQVKQSSKQSALILANPDFGEEAIKGQASERMLRYRPVSETDTGKGTILADAYFPPLPGTGDEALAVSLLLSGSTLLVNKDATEARLKQTSSPNILHIATHGFFLADEMVQDSAARLLVTKTATSPGTSPNISLTNNPTNPLYRSGLALAGANQLKSDSNEDGILTALETAGLDLWGTKMVVLSACETGLGEVRDGDGVYGLRRALVLAGAETQVMSLWAVSDLATRNLMIEYYRRLQRGEGRAEAMRQAQLGLLNKLKRGGKRNYSHPYYWASFIQSGEWANLDGQR
ncbi:MAG TPA: CHAT domain-containing protein [Blastocatellia bacterium]|nr:CHAT domain-containing protein [Blastocatellia bacterium]